MASFSGVSFLLLFSNLRRRFLFFFFGGVLTLFAHANAFGYFWAGVPFILLLLN